MTLTLEVVGLFIISVGQPVKHFVFAEQKLLPNRLYLWAGPF